MSGQFHGPASLTFVPIGHIWLYHIRKNGKLVSLRKSIYFKILAYFLVSNVPDYEKKQSFFNADCVVPKPRMLELYVYSPIRRYDLVFK
jgi:hypothetical protein